MENVIYCEWLGLGDPIEVELPKNMALERYTAKFKALKGYLFKDTSFIGIKDLKGNWICKNERKNNNWK